MSFQFKRVQLCSLSTTDHLFDFSVISHLNTKQLLFMQLVDQVLYFFHLYNT